MISGRRFNVDPSARELQLCKENKGVRFTSWGKKVNLTPFFHPPMGEFNLEAQHWAKDFGRGAIGKTFTRTIIQLVGDSCNPLVADL